MQDGGFFDRFAKLFASMAWTWPTAMFFSAVVIMLLIMTVWEISQPTTERRGFLPMATTRGDRLFIGLLGAAWIHLGWLMGTDAYFGVEWVEELHEALSAGLQGLVAVHVLAALLMGERRFTGLQHATQAAPNILSERLTRLIPGARIRYLERSAHSPKAASAPLLPPERRRKRRGFLGRSDCGVTSSSTTRMVCESRRRCRSARSLLSWSLRRRRRTTSRSEAR